MHIMTHFTTTLSFQFSLVWLLRKSPCFSAGWTSSKQWKRIIHLLALEITNIFVIHACTPAQFIVMQSKRSSQLQGVIERPLIRTLRCFLTYLPNIFQAKAKIKFLFTTSNAFHKLIHARLNQWPMICIVSIRKWLAEQENLNARLQFLDVRTPALIS